VLRFARKQVCLTLVLSACGGSTIELDERDAKGGDEGGLGIPYGFWGLNGYIDEDGLADVKARFHMTAFHTSTRDPTFGVGTLLPLVRDAGLVVNLRMVGDHEAYVNADGDFQLEAWKAMLDPWLGSGVQEFIDDGTLANHMLVDDITEFEGEGPDGDELEAMAAYSHDLLPGLRTLVREEAAEMPIPTGGRYQEVDANVNQYRFNDGAVEDYVARQVEASEALGLEIVNGLNIADGGDGSSGKPGWGEGNYAMSADEIRTYGAVLAAMPGCTMFLNWEYDGEEAWAEGGVGSDYFDQSELTDALDDLGKHLGE
jgi:hypothetical protein